jgi:hypothetical protein
LFYALYYLFASIYLLLFHLDFHTSGQGENVLNFFQVARSEIPMGLIVETNKLFRNFRHYSPISDSALINFESGFRSKTIEPSLKSQHVKMDDGTGVKDMVS